MQNVMEACLGIKDYISTKNVVRDSVLIVDDEVLIRNVIKEYLILENYDYDEAENGKEAVDKVEKNNFDIVIMDIMMPNMSGETALRKLKENSSFKKPVIALTADSVSGAKEKYLSEGFIDYISKPFSRDQIKEKLDVIFKNSSFSEDNQNTLKYNPNIDRFKGTEAYVFGESSNSRDYEII